MRISTYEFCGDTVQPVTPTDPVSGLFLQLFSEQSSPNAALSPSQIFDVYNSQPIILEDTQFSLNNSCVKRFAQHIQRHIRYSPCAVGLGHLVRDISLRQCQSSSLSSSSWTFIKCWINARHCSEGFAKKKKWLPSLLLLVQVYIWGSLGIERVSKLAKWHQWINWRGVNWTQIIWFQHLPSAWKEPTLNVNHRQPRSMARENTALLAEILLLVLLSPWPWVSNLYYLLLCLLLDLTSTIGENKRKCVATQMFYYLCCNF